MSVFEKPSKPTHLTFLLRGESGTGKTRFALGLTAAAAATKKKPVAVIGSDRGARFYADANGIGPFVHVEAATLAEFDAALKEVRRRKRSFSGVIVDSVTDWWNLEQKAHEVETKDGGRVVPPRAWRTIREEREEKFRLLQSLPMHVILVAEERPIFERDGAELREIGTREDTDKRDPYLADVRLRFFQKDGRVHAEVLKDRTGRYAMGTILRDPTIDLWLAPESAQAARPAGTQTPLAAAAAAATLEEHARTLLDDIGAIRTADAWRRWRWTNAKTLDGILAALPDGLTKASLIAMAKAKSAEFDAAARPEASA